MRTLSHSETDTWLDCSLKGDLAYGGHTLGGYTLKSRVPHYYLRRGSAWGVGVQAWHTTGDLASAESAMSVSLAKDAEVQHREGVYDADEHIELVNLLYGCIGHYARTMPRLELAEPEKRLLVKVPGLRGWRLDVRLDGVATVGDELYPFESKLRKSLTDYEVITRQRQPRWYAAGWWLHTGRMPAGFIVDERLAQAAPPADAAVVMTQGSKPRKDGSQKDPPRPAHTGQTCTAERYIAACHSTGAYINEETVESCRKRHDSSTYHGRHVLRFTKRELLEAIEQMRSAAHLIRLHERGQLTPIRNPSHRCQTCAFRVICADPNLEEAQAIFKLTTPKRLRGPEAATT